MSDGVGTRLAEERKFAGLTQQQLADRAHVSVSLVRKVERGTVPASAALIAAAARALGVTPSELTEMPARRSSRADTRLHATLIPLRRELASYGLIPDNGTSRPLSELAAATAEVSQFRHRVALDQLGAALPGLLCELRLAVHTTEGAERERAFSLLCETYAAASQLAYKLGYVDLASLAVDRYEWAARQSGDPLTVHVGHYQRAGELINVADWASALSLLRSARRTLEPELCQDRPATLAMWGNLHLKSGLAAARSGNAELADDHLAEAARTAQRLDPDRNDYQLVFNRTNVEIWAVSLAVECMDGPKAIKRAKDCSLRPDTPRERIGQHWIDLSRGYFLHGDRQRALQALLKARELAPQQTRYHPHVHETARALARSDRRRTDSLAGFVAWLGLSAQGRKASEPVGM